MLLIIAGILLAVSFMPLQKSDHQLFTAGVNRIRLLPVPHLSPDDLANQGDTVQLTVLPGVGPSIAQEILREREENGVFYYPEDLAAVRGIGEKKLEQIAPMLTLLLGESEE